MRRPRYPSPNIGDKFSRLTVIGNPRYKSGSNHRYIPCRCDCGNEIVTQLSQLRSKHTNSCGCYKREQTSKANSTHAESQTRLYGIWCKMKDRTSTPTNPSFPNWGGRGIILCQEWKEYVPFRNWALANGYHESLQIDRIDNDSNYSPDNCHWITQAAQQRNTRRNHLLTAFNETKCMSAWIEDPRCSVSYSALKSRIRKGWDTELAITMPNLGNSLKLKWILCGKQFLPR